MNWEYFSVSLHETWGWLFVKINWVTCYSLTEWRVTSAVSWVLLHIVVLRGFHPFEPKDQELCSCGLRSDLICASLYGFRLLSEVLSYRWRFSEFCGDFANDTLVKLQHIPKSSQLLWNRHDCLCGSYFFAAWHITVQLIHYGTSLSRRIWIDLAAFHSREDARYLRGFLY